MDDDFDRALMEALNEAVPPVALSPGLAGRLVTRVRRRSRLWKMFVALFAISVVFGAVWTVSELAAAGSADGDDDGRGVADAIRESGTLAASFSGETVSNPAIALTSQTISTPTSGDSHVKTTPLKSTVAFAGVLALAAAQPSATRAATPLSTSGDGYQYIVSGYPAANPSRSTRSASTSLETGAYRIASAADALEARYRTREISNATALRSDEFTAMIIIVR